MEFKRIWDEAEKRLWALKIGHKGEEAHLGLALEIFCEHVTALEERVRVLENHMRENNESISRLQRGIKLGGGM